MEIRYPHIEVELIGHDGNAFNLIGLTTRALKKAKVPADQVQEFQSRCFNATSYDNLLNIVQETVVVS